MAAHCCDCSPHECSGTNDMGRCPEHQAEWDAEWAELYGTVEP